jgi:hypothetical protein
MYEENIACMKDDKLLVLLEAWFEQADFSRSHFLTRDKVAKLLKEKLSKVNHWKDGRGPDKGRRAFNSKSLANLAKPYEPKPPPPPKDDDWF